MRKVIITGPTGTIGSAMCDLLTRNKINVYAICRKGSKNIANLVTSPYLHIIECDISSLLSLEGKIPSNVDAFYHLAWNGTIGDARNLIDIQLSNVKYSIDAVTLAKNLNSKVFIGAGSQAEYGIFNEPADEKVPTKPFTLYGAAKLSAGNLTRVYAKSLGLKHIWARIFSVYGPNDDEKTLISYVINKLKSDKIPEVTECNQIWDYLYSYDAAKALLLLADKGMDGKIYSVGSGQKVKLKHYADAIKNIINPNISINFGAKKYSPNQVMFLSANIDDLVKDTGFHPRYSFTEGIAEILNNKRGEKY